jgi:serine/threonine protein kinase
MPAMKLCPKCQKQFSDDANFCPVDAARLVPLEAQATGTDSLTAKFDLGPKLGGTRTGAVYRATDKATGKACVVKLVSPAVVSLSGVAQRIERELKQLERVQSVGVCRVLASGKRPAMERAGFTPARGEDEYWVATELLEGAHTLEEAIRARGPIPIEQAANLIELIGEALIEAAQVGVVHRDLAPKNILFAGNDVKLINFSLPVPTIDKIPGVPEFVAPEQVDGRPVDQRSNLYSLGALYYYVLTGQTVHAGSAEEVHKQHQAGSIKPPSQLISLPQPLETVIMRALDRSPTKRFLTVRQFVDEVTRVGHGEVIELKQTVAMGKAGSRPKAELVQTLLGVKGQFGTAPGSPPPPNSSPVQQLAHAAMPGPANATMQSGPPAMPPPSGTAHGPGIPQQSPAIGMQPLSNPNAPTTSPWAPPGQGPAAPTAQLSPAAPAPTPSVPAAPVLPSAPVVAAPVVASPQAAAAAPAGKRGAAPAEDNKGKFRETMWFKKGDLDAQAAIAAAEERARTGKDVTGDKADSKPIDERYNDDGSITRGDKEKYSLRTGSTMMMSSLDPKKASASHTKVSEDELIGEMKSGRTKVIAAIVAGVIVILLIIFMIAR